MRTLISYLNQRPPAELKVIAEFWNADLTSRLFSGNAFELAKQISTEYLQRRVLEKLNRELVQILSLFLVRPDATITLAELSRDAGKTVAETETLVKKLREFGLVYNDTVKIEAEEQLLPAPPARRRGPFGASPSPTLSLFKQKPVLIVPRELSRPFQRMLAERQGTGKLSNSPLARLLDKLEPEKLEGIAETWGIYGLQGSGTKQEYVIELNRAICNTVAQRKILAELSPDSLELFEELKKRPRTTIPELLKTYVSERRLGRSLSPLTEVLLVWEGFEDGESALWIPAEIAQAKDRPAEETQITLQTVSEPTEATMYPPYALAWDILTFLNYVLQNEVEVTNQAQIPKRHLKKLVTLFWKPEDVDTMPRSAFLINLTNSLDLVDRGFGDKKIQGGEELEHWLALDMYDQMREIVDNWGSLSGFYGPFYLPFYYATPDSREAIIKSVMEWLRQWCEPHVWYSLNSLIVKIEKEQPFFIRSRKDMLNQFGAQRIQQILKQWPQVEGNIIRTLFDTALEWLGIIRVSRDKNGKVVAFSLTDFGAELAEVPGAVPQTLPETDKPLVALANFEIMLFVPQTLTLMRLLQIAELKQLDKVSLFTLTRASVLKGLESGLSSTKIIEFLEQNSAQPVPQNLIISIQDWSKGFKQARLRRVVLLESDDPAVLDELIASKQFAGVFADRLSPTAVLVTMEEPDPFSRADPLKSFRTKLRNSGISVR